MDDVGYLGDTVSIADTEPGTDAEQDSATGDDTETDLGAGSDTGRNTDFDTDPVPNSDTHSDTDTVADCVDDVAESPCWFADAWKYRQKVTISSRRIPEDQLDFPVLLSDHRSNWKGPVTRGHVGQIDGGDILFTANDGRTKLDHELEKYDPSTGQLVAWVKVPRLKAATDTVIYLYYGNPAGNDQWAPQRVWGDGKDGHFKAVWHMEEGTSANRLDSTAYGNHCAPFNYDGDEGGEGIIAGADILDGTDDWLTCGRDPSLNIREEITLSAWIRPGDERPQKERWRNGPYKNTYGFYLYGKSNAVTTVGSYFEINGASVDIYEGGAIDIPPGQWAYVAVTYDGIDIRAYINAQLDYAFYHPGRIDDSGNEDYTFSYREGKDHHLSGSVDEIRVSNVARSADWLATCFNNQRAPDEFYTISPEMTHALVAQ